MSGTPFLKIVRGDAAPEEIAALVAALATTATSATPPAKTVHEPRNWRNPARRLRRPLTHGPGAWRATMRID
jgi:hypothetical protein